MAEAASDHRDDATEVLAPIRPGDAERRPAARLAVAVPAGVARLLLPRAVPRTVVLQGQAHVTVGQVGHGGEGVPGLERAPYWPHRVR